MTNRTTEELARHEAAHFVVHWAIGCPALHVDITPKARRVCCAGKAEQVGVTFGCIDTPTPFQHIFASLAGPVADHLGKCDDELLEADKDEIERTVQEIANGIPHPDSGDWEACLHAFNFYGIDVCNRQHLTAVLLIFIAAVRELLKLCEMQWREATDYLVKYGRIGYDGEHPDNGEGAELFFSRWGDELGQPAKEITECVSQIRIKAENFKVVR